MEVELPKPGTFVGIDQSYGGFGLAILRHDGTEETHLWKFPSKGSDAERLLRISDKLFSNLCWEISVGSLDIPCYFAIEGYAHGAKFNREKLGELGGTVKMAIHSASGKDPIIIPPTVLKKFMTGKGTASKEAMVAAVQEYNSDITDHNVADAYALALYIKENHGAL